MNFSEDTLTDALAGRAILALEDGRVFNGRAAGAHTRRGGEVVFNTSLTGYQEVFTDPSYSGQIVCLTYPHIGNVGSNRDDHESARPYIESLVVREFSRARLELAFHGVGATFLERYGVPVIWDLDTRALVRPFANVGALRGDRLNRRHAGRTTDCGSARAADDGRPGTRKPRHVRENVRLEGWSIELAR